MTGPPHFSFPFMISKNIKRPPKDVSCLEQLAHLSILFISIISVEDPRLNHVWSKYIRMPRLKATSGHLHNVATPISMQSQSLHAICLCQIFQSHASSES